MPLSLHGGNICPTFKLACQLLGLLENENHLHNVMQEAVESRAPSKIHLFIIILTTYFPANAKALWDQYKDFMTEDILYRLRNETNNPDLQLTYEMYNNALMLIEDNILVIMGRTLSDFDVAPPQSPARLSFPFCTEELQHTATFGLFERSTASSERGKRTTRCLHDAKDLLWRR